MATGEGQFKVPAFKAPPVPVVAASAAKNIEGNSEDDQQQKDEVIQDQQEKQLPTCSKKPLLSPAELLKDRSSSLNYRQPPNWVDDDDDGKLPPTNVPYLIEEIKNGTIVKTHKLVGKTFFVVGRLPVNDIQLEHPSLSRHHAVLQYKSIASEQEPIGFYLCDLGSTHGSFHNKHKCYPNRYYRLRVGHCLKFGGSTRMLILQGPDQDMEDESDLSVTELKAIAAEKARQKRAKAEEEEGSSGGGISWGMADDATEEEEAGGVDDNDGPPDMSRNPFAVIKEEEELNLNDPKKTLKSWYEKEGFDQPDYQCSETGYAKFKCSLELPVDDEQTGRPLVATAEVTGKKKEAVAQCAMEACRLLDRAGVLRSSKSDQVSVARLRAKRLQEDDFYASDEDEFLDRTGTLEVKRQKRKKMLSHYQQEDKEKSETFESLSEKSGKLLEEVSRLQERLEKAQRAVKESAKQQDDLDAFMANLNEDGGSKEELSKLKLKLANLIKEKEKVDRLVELTRPTKMPELKARPAAASTNTAAAKQHHVMVGKMFGSKKSSAAAAVKLSAAPPPTQMTSLVKRVNKAFDDDEQEDDEAAKKAARLPSLEQFKKDIEEEKQRIVVQSAATPSASAKPKETSAAKQLPPPPTTKSFKRQTLPEAMMKPPAKQKKKSMNNCEMPDSYESVAAKDDKYETWVPPAGQTGDGRTSLNDKFGY